MHAKATGLLTALVAAGVVLAPPASAAEAAWTDVELMVVHEHGAAVKARLTCPPTSESTHPDSQAACAALDAVAGDLDVLPVDTEAQCTYEWMPLTASATGVINGRPVEWAKEYPNQCVLDRETGVVFAVEAPQPA
ncbi:Subtilisin inhibitor-like [Actinosynnema pretiosum]|nr:Subtilisin inhibitor-like [Actinosynnema pretiosum]